MNVEFFFKISPYFIGSNSVIPKIYAIILPETFSPEQRAISPSFLIVSNKSATIKNALSRPVIERKYISSLIRSEIAGSALG